MFRGCCGAFAGTGVTPAMHAVLMIARDNPGIRQSAMADALMVKPSNVAAAGADLEAAGFVLRTIDPSDARVIATTLTDAGQRLLEELQVRLDAFEQEMLSGLDAREQQELRRLLSRLSASNR